ncbi:hypothetical protein ACNKHK_02140 [Shigella flexneri]
MEGAIDALNVFARLKMKTLPLFGSGGYQLPLAADALAKTGKYDAVIALVR